MAITERLFDKYPYETCFSSKVLNCEKGERGFWVELDRTLFFPEEGGQSPDKGVLDGKQVLDVEIEKECIRHLLEEEVEVGKEVDGTIDWTHRFSNMQQHSGEHIFSGTVHKWFGYRNVGFHLSDQIVTMDFDGILTEEDVDRIEDYVNSVIVANLPVEASYPTKEELETLSYRSKIEIEGQVRIVTIPGVDVCACCAPHVQRTGEIGQLKVMNLMNYKGGVRISFLCGFRALEEERLQGKILASLTKELTTNQESLVSSVVKLKNQTISLNSKLMGVKQKLLEIELEKVPLEQKDVLLFESGLEDSVMRNGVNYLLERHEGICGIFSGDENTGYKFILGSSKRDCRLIAAALREKLQGKGGGTSVMIQGHVNATEEVIRDAILTM